MMEYMESKMQDYIENGIGEADRCYARIAELEEQNAALVVRASRMSTFIKLSAEKWKGVPEVEPTFWNLLRVANEAPQHHLAELRVEVVTEAADKMGEAFILPASLRRETQKAEFYKAGWRDAFLFLKQYAASIRREGK